LDICPICLSDPLIDAVKCKTCSKSFCQKCVLLWKISGDYDGFIICPGCKQLGSLRCPKSSCRLHIDYVEIPLVQHFLCKICQKQMKYFQALPHLDCDFWNRSFYFWCEMCDKKFCNCIMK